MKLLSLASGLALFALVGTDKPEDRYSHGYDRRVDVVLVGVSRTPL